MMLIRRYAQTPGATPGRGGLGLPTPQRTPRAGTTDGSMGQSRAEALLTEAQRLQQLTELQTPLLGGEVRLKQIVLLINI